MTDFDPALEKETSGGVRSVGRAAAVLLVTWVAAGLVFTMIPTESVLRQKLQPVFGPWRSLSGTEQHWDMFGTVPHHRSYAVSVEVQAPSTSGWQTLEDLGPVFPDLKPLPRLFRYHTFFTRLDDKRYNYALDPYLAKLGNAIVAAHPELKGGRFRLRKEAQRIHPLETIRDLGEPSYEQTVLHGPLDLPTTPTP